MSGSIKAYDAYGSITNDTIDIAANAIQGKCVAITHHFSTADTIYSNLHEDEIKKILIEKLAEELHRQNVVEFTKFLDSNTHGTMYRARLFAVPDSQVRLLREAKVIK